MTVDSLNIASGNASALVLNQFGKNNPEISRDKAFANFSDKTNSVTSISQKSIFEVNKSATPLNKPIESNQNSLKSSLYGDVNHKSISFPPIDAFPNSAMEIIPVVEETGNSALIEQKGWFITILPDNRMNGGFLEITEHRDERKEKIKDFYNPVVNLNKGKLLDIVT